MFPTGPNHRQPVMEVSQWLSVSIPRFCPVVLRSQVLLRYPQCQRLRWRLPLSPWTTPLRETIAAYHGGYIAFCAASDEEWDTDEGHDALVERTYGPAYEALGKWGQPATTLQGAIDALRLAKQESDDIMASPVVPAMIAAVIGYLEAVSKTGAQEVANV
ncbi:hypothetical protein [Aestuariivirga sp.]|uniref:hypothetical protein n=1 Tax=Aestuariivirga sp. TaxID=2650926 RepID=UPI0035945F89